jgi:hypothetical protein
MAESLHPPPASEITTERLAWLEARLARIEAQLGLTPAPSVPGPPNEHPPSGAAIVPVELEGQWGQRAFTLAGVVALTSGLGFLLSLPHSSLPPAAPAGAGIALASTLILMAHVLRKRFALLAGYVRGAAVLLLYFATLRLFFFGPQPAIDLESITGRGLIVLATMDSAALAWRSRSRWLALLALLIGCATGLVVGTGTFLLVWLPLFAFGTVVIGRKWEWPALSLAAIPLVHGT